MIDGCLKCSTQEQVFMSSGTQIIDVDEHLCDSLLKYKESWEAKGIDLVGSFAVNVFVEASPMQLYEVWDALLSNAISYTPRGGEILVQLEADDNWVWVSVSDYACADTVRDINSELMKIELLAGAAGGVASLGTTSGIGHCFTVKLPRLK